MRTRRVSLPLSKDGATVDMVLAGHIFDHGALGQDYAFSLVHGLQQSIRAVIED
jgi:hypothetical protein